MKERMIYFMKGAGPLFSSKSAGPGAMTPLAPLKTATDDHSKKTNKRLLCKIHLFCIGVCLPMFQHLNRNCARKNERFYFQISFQTPRCQHIYLFVTVNKLLVVTLKPWDLH